MRSGGARALPAVLLLLVLLPVGLGPLVGPRVSPSAAQQAIALLDQSYGLTTTNQWSECVTVSSHATSLDPHSARSYNNLAWMLQERSRLSASSGSEDQPLPVRSPGGER